MIPQPIGKIIQNIQWMQNPGYPVKNPDPVKKPEKPEKEREGKEIEKWPSIGDPYEYQEPVNHTENYFAEWKPENM